ncbi:ccr4 associated factor [Saitoella coloradoensis]
MRISRSPISLFRSCQSQRRWNSTSCSLPPPPPTTGFTNLSSKRKLIALWGLDASKFLNGLTTNHLPPAGSTEGLYNGFLTPQGRVLYDTFIYPASHSSQWTNTANSTDEAYFIEVDANAHADLQLHLKRYKLRAKCKIRSLEDEYTVCTSWGLPSVPSYSIGCVDPRAPEMGQRFVLPAEAKPEIDAEEASVDQYTLRRYMQGVPEGMSEIFSGSALPLESCMDYMSGVDFRKGCYVGQELTVRTYHTGVTRKRILPVQLYNLDQHEAIPTSLTYDPMTTLPTPPSQANLTRPGKKGRSAGKFCGGIGNIGLALARLEIVGTTDTKDAESVEDKLVVEWEEETAQEDGEKEKRSIGMRAFVPEWWPRADSQE